VPLPLPLLGLCGHHSSLTPQLKTGTTYSYGVYLREYSHFFEAPSSQLSFVGTLSPALFTGTGIVTGRLGDKLGPRPVVFVGMVLYSTSLISASFAEEVWHLYLTQGVLLGVSGAFVYYPTSSLVPSWVLFVPSDAPWAKFSITAFLSPHSLPRGAGLQLGWPWLVLESGGSFYRL